MIPSPSPALPSLPGANPLKAGVKAGPAEVLPAPAGSPAGTAPLDFSQVLDASAPAPTKTGGNALQAVPVASAANIPPAPAPESAAPEANPTEPSGKGGKILPGREKVAANAIQEAVQNRSAEKPSGKTAGKVSHGIPGETPVAAPQMANSESQVSAAEPSLPENPQPAATTGTPPQAPVIAQLPPAGSTGTAGALALLQTRNTRAPMAATAAPTPPSVSSPTRAPPPAAVLAANTSAIALPLQLPDAPPEGRVPNLPAQTGLPPSAQPVAMKQGRATDMPEVRLTAPVVAPGPAPMTATSEILKAGARTVPEVTTAAVPQVPEAPVDAQRVTAPQTPSAPMSVSSTATQDVPSTTARPHDPEPATDPVATAPLASAAAPTLAPTTAPTTTTAPSPEAPQDFATLVQRLNEAREAVTPQVVQTALVHAEFGRVNLALRHEDGGLSVTMASLDPTFAPAVQAALAAGADTARERMQGEAQQQAPSRHGSEPRGESNQQRQDGGMSSGSGSASAHGTPSGSTTASNGGQHQRDTARGNAAADTRPARNGGSGTGFPGGDASPSSPRSGPQASGLYA